MEAERPTYAPVRAEDLLRAHIWDITQSRDILLDRPEIPIAFLDGMEYLATGYIHGRQKTVMDGEYFHNAANYDIIFEILQRKDVTGTSPYINVKFYSSSIEVTSNSVYFEHTPVPTATITAFQNELTQRNVHLHELLAFTLPNGETLPDVELLTIEHGDESTGEYLDLTSVASVVEWQPIRARMLAYFHERLAAHGLTTDDLVIPASEAAD